MRKLEKFIPVLCLLSILAFFSVDASTLDIYVSKTGSVHNPGTMEKPVSTLEEARDLIRKYKSVESNPSEKITVWVGEGEYRQLKPFVLNENDSGDVGNPIIWRAEKGARVVVSGGVSLPVDKFHKVRDRNILKRLTRESRRNVECISLPSVGINDYGTFKQIGHALPAVVSPLQLYFEEKPMPLAHYPNKGFVQIGKILDSGSFPRNGDYSNRGAVIVYSDPRHSVWAGQKDVWFQGTFWNGYGDDMLHVEKIDPRKKTVKFSTPHLYGVRGGRPYTHYVALNILEELDSPGEWYLDRKDGTLYFWAPSDMKTGSVKVSMIEDPIVCLEGVRNVVFRDFIVENGRGIGIYMERGKNNLIAGCTVRDVGTTGICMGQGAKQTFPLITHDDYDGVPVSRRVGNYATHLYRYTTWNRRAGSNQKILSCDIYNTGSGGIILSGGSKKNLVNGNNVVENCKIHDYNLRNKFRWAGIIVDGCGNRMVHNEIFNSDFQAIFSVGPEHLFEYNDIHDVTLHSDDVSAWYTGRDPSDRGLVIRYNYFHNCGNAKRMNMGVYCDDSSTGITVYGNVFYKMETGHGVLYSNGGWDLIMKNNIIIEPASYCVVISPQYYTWAKNRIIPTFGKNGLFVRRLLKDINITKPPYSDRYPELVNYMDPIIPGKEWEGMRSRRNIFTSNVIVGGKKNLISFGGKKYAIFKSLNNFRTDGDPGFVDYKNENFNLRKDSQVFDKIPGFEPLPFDKMGLYVDEYRKEL